MAGGMSRGLLGDQVFHELPGVGLLHQSGNLGR
jgi:hypothetical protein